MSPVVSSAAEVFVASGAVSKAATDSFYVFGEPGTLEGKFQSGPNGVVPDRQGWTGVDRTDQPVYWQVSEFNASTLNGNGPGNRAVWSGQSAAQQSGWVSAPGYGNEWIDLLQFEVEVTDTAAGQVVDLDFYFHYDTEPGYDFFRVEYEKSDGWHTVFEVSGTDRDASGQFFPPGTQYAESAGAAPIVYAGGDYADGVAIRVRLVVRSDSAWSDEDGLFDSHGAVQVDELFLSCSEGVFVEGFESGLFDGKWLPKKAPWFGDFFEAYARLSDIDPCGLNITPIVAFVDAGQTVNNSICWIGPPPPDECSTGGGSQSPTWSYGFLGNWVLDYSDERTGGEVFLHNELQSPPIPWNLPTPDDDAPEFAGALLSFDVWEHLPYENGIFWTWAVRSSVDGGATFRPWRNRGYRYFGQQPRWRRIRVEIGDLLEPGLDTVQLALGVIDLSRELGLPGNDATPSPVYDNVRLQKYRLAGPVLSARDVDLAQDGFPNSSTLDVSTPAARDALDVRFDMAQSIGGGSQIVPGDSVVVGARTVIPGTTLADLRMVWRLEKNPLFEDAIRRAPSRGVDQNVDTSDASVWTGEVTISLVKAEPPLSEGPPTFAFDLPDQDFLYPGDVLRHHFRATDSDGRVTTLPRDLTGFVNGELYPREFEVHALPTLQDVSGARPSLLVVDAQEEGVDLGFALGQIGFVEGVDYDRFRVAAPGARISNGIGSFGGHGATASQLEGYAALLVASGRSGAGVLSDGSTIGTNDASPDIGVLIAWHQLDGDRSAIHFGDALASGLMASGGLGAFYAQSILGVEVVDDDVRDEIGDQFAPVIFPDDSSFAAEVALGGGCPQPRRFDSLRALAPAWRGHGFQPPWWPPNVEYPDIAASVVYDRLGADGSRKLDLSFPFALEAIVGLRDGAPTDGISARSTFLAEVLGIAGENGSGVPTSAPELRRATLSVHPNPFNPRTDVRLQTPRDGNVAVDVFDLRGRRVRRLHQGELASGPHAWTWRGKDDAGANVASGVYVIRAVGPGFELTQKAALVR